MATEVQRIIAMSLNKIVASRSRRGGVSLHRNLLVASVLLRAKDVYIAETVAKRKKDMDAEAVVPNLECTEASEEDDLSGEITEEKNDESPLSQSSNICSKPDDKLCHFDEHDSEAQIEDEEFHSYDSEHKQTEVDTDSVDTFSDNSKENLDPNVPTSDCVSRCSSRKRRIRELDSSVLEYSDLEQTAADTECDSSHLNHSDSVESEPCCKYVKLNTPCNIDNRDIDYDEKSELSSKEQILQSDSGRCWDYSSNSDCDNKSSEEQVTLLRSSYSCPSDQQIFSQVTLAHTNLLIATM